MWTTIAVDPTGIDLIPVGMENVFVVTPHHVTVGNIVNQEHALVRNCLNTMIHNKYFDLKYYYNQTEYNPSTH